jgi:hypothetical protein
MRSTRVLPRRRLPRRARGSRASSRAPSTSAKWRQGPRDGEHRRSRPLDLSPRRDRERARPAARRRTSSPRRSPPTGRAIRARPSASPCGPTTCPRSGSTGARDSLRCSCSRPSSSRSSPCSWDRPGTTGTTCLVLDESSHARRGYREVTQHYPRPGGSSRTRTSSGSPCSAARATPSKARRRRLRPRRDRHHEPARDDDRLGSGDGRCRRTAHRLAGPADGRALQGAPRRPHPRPARGSCPIRTSRRRSSSGSSARPRATSLSGRSTQWLIWKLTGGAVHANRSLRTPSRTLLLVDLATLDWDDELLELFGVPRSGASRDRQLERDDRRGRDLRGTRADRRGGRRPAGGSFRTGLLRTRSGEGNVRHRRPFSWRTAAPSGAGPEMASSRRRLAARSQEPVYAVEGSIFVTGAALQWLRDALGLLPTRPTATALARAVADNGGVYFVPARRARRAALDPGGARVDQRDLGRDASRATRQGGARSCGRSQARDVRRRPSPSSSKRSALTAAEPGTPSSCSSSPTHSPSVEVPEERETTALGAAALAGLAVAPGTGRTSSRGSGGGARLRARAARGGGRAPPSEWRLAVRRALLLR